MALGAGSRGRALIAAVLLSTSSVTAYERNFSGSYTIVNKASGRRIVSDAHGFYTVGQEPIYRSHVWQILPQQNTSYILANAASGARIYAQLGKDWEQGFFTIGPGGQAYQDQRWHLLFHSDGSYSLANVKSGRRVVDGPQGFAALAGASLAAEEARWWLINQDMDESGPLMLQLQAERESAMALSAGTEQCQQESRKRWADLQAARSQIAATAAALQALEQANGDLARDAHLSRAEADELAVALRSEREAMKQAVEDATRSAMDSCIAWPTWMDSQAALTLVCCLAACAASIAAAARRAKESMLGSDFGHHISSVEVDGETARLIRVQCPGVSHEHIKVELIPNGCDVSIARLASPGLQATTWQRRFRFELEEGLFEFKEEQMQLEQGVLQLVFKQIRYQDRTIRFAKHYSLDAFDDSLCWEYPSAAVEDVFQQPDSNWKVPPCAADTVSVAGSSQSTASSLLRSPAQMA